MQTDEGVFRQRNAKFLRHDRRQEVDEFTSEMPLTLKNPLGDPSVIEDTGFNQLEQKNWNGKTIGAAPTRRSPRT